MLQLRVDSFEGPLDLLLDLLEKEQIEITGVSLAQVADQYWEHVRSGGEPDAEVLSEFIEVGVRLLYLKSCALLPQPAIAVEAHRPISITDDGTDLVQMLQQHRRFRDVAAVFRQLEAEGRKVYSRGGRAAKADMPDGLQGLSLDTLLAAVQEAMLRKPEEPQLAILEIEPMSIQIKMAELGKMLSQRRGRVPLRTMLETCETRTEIVVLFLAVLELLKVGRLWAEQGQAFGEIVLVESGAEPV